MHTFISVDGGWSNWQSWSVCTMSGRSCKQYRIRNCDNPAPVGTGLVCMGNATENRICDAESCDSEYFGLSDN